MSNIPQISGKELVKALQKIGFEKIRQKGSHIRLVRMKKDSKEVLTIPDHKIIRKGTLVNGILKPINLSIEDLKKLL